MTSTTKCVSSAVRECVSERRAWARVPVRKGAPSHTLTHTPKAGPCA